METYNTVAIINAMLWGHSVEKEESARKKQARHLQVSMVKSLSRPSQLGVSDDLFY